MPIDPVTFMAGTTLLSTGLGINESRKNRRAMQRASDQNYKLGLRDQNIRQALGLLTRQDSQRGQVDSRGNRTFFEPGVGFKTELSDRSQQLQSASDRENLIRSTQDATRSRTAQQRGAREADTAGRIGAGKLNSMQRSGRVTPEMLTSAQRNDSVGRNDQSTGNLLESFLRNQTRNGSTGNARALQALQGAAAGNLPSRGTGVASGITQAGQINQTQEANDMNIISSLLNRSAAVPGTPFVPVNIPGPSANAQIGTQPQTSAITAGLLGAESPTVAAPQPVEPWSLAIGSAGDMFSGLLAQRAAEREAQNNRNLTAWFMGNRNAMFNPLMLEAAGMGFSPYSNSGVASGIEGSF